MDVDSPRIPQDRSRVPKTRVGSTSTCRPSTMTVPSHVPHCVRRVCSLVTIPSRVTLRCRGSSTTTVRARHVRSHVSGESFGATVKRSTRIGSTTSMRIGPMLVDRSSGMRPEAKTECSVPSMTMLNAASMTPSTG